jgi:two-component system OmpR family sensor kinase
MSAIASSTVNRLLIGGWAVAAVFWSALMWIAPGKETVPFHFIWIGLALVYGFTHWRTAEMVAALVGVAAVTGFIMVHHASQGQIGWEETSEVPLMMAVFGVMVWHVRRRNLAVTEARRLAGAENRRLEVQQLFLRLASHELRTPITVARGYTELVRDAHQDPVTLEDTGVVLDELDKLARITQRVVTLMQMEEPYPLQPTSLDRQLAHIARRWRPTADRLWSVSSDIGTAMVNAERLEAAIDCLIENAVNGTEPGDRIALIGSATPTGWHVEISDTGRGMTEHEVARLLAGQPVNYTGTGLGIAIVRSVVAALDGELRIQSCPGDGTSVTIAVPAAGPTPVGPALAVAASDEPVVSGA